MLSVLIDTLEDGAEVQKCPEDVIPLRSSWRPWDLADAFVASSAVVSP